MNSALATIRSSLREQELDAVLLSSSPNSIYATGFTGFSETERDGYVLVTSKTCYILTSTLYENAIKNTTTGIKLAVYTRETPLPKLITEISQKESLKTLGIETENLTVAEWLSLKIIPVSLKPFSSKGLRVTKNESELACLMKASRIADRALRSITHSILPGITEKDVVRLLEDAIKKAGGESAFPTIVAFGSNAASPHHRSSTAKLKTSDTILIDFGAKVQGYHSDMTRTFLYGSPPKKHLDMYQAVLRSQHAAVTCIETRLRDNAPIQAALVDQKARDYLKSLGYPSIPHSLGHGIGLAVHEAPSLSPVSQDLLTEGMVFSIEPGVYIPGEIGIRIEDLYVIQDNKLRAITHYPKKTASLEHH